MSQIETTDLTAPELRVSINSLVQHFVLLLTENAQQYFAGPGNRSRYLLPSSSTCNHSSNEFVLKVLLLYINVFGE
ncbi:hypothetical protein SFRURICE_019364 [Spodoptera frugiperda]|nr:hypothetical protein SFRURICE_019364 [Spodoptera frugiperda]